MITSQITNLTITNRRIKMTTSRITNLTITNQRIKMTTSRITSLTITNRLIKMTTNLPWSPTNSCHHSVTTNINQTLSRLISTLISLVLITRNPAVASEETSMRIRNHTFLRNTIRMSLTSHLNL